MAQSNILTLYADKKRELNLIENEVKSLKNDLISFLKTQKGYKASVAGASFSMREVKSYQYSSEVEKLESYIKNKKDKFNDIIQPKIDQLIELKETEVVTGAAIEDKEPSYIPVVRLTKNKDKTVTEVKVEKSQSLESLQKGGL